MDDMNGPPAPSNGGSQSENTVLKRAPRAELPGAVGAGTVLSERYRLIGTPEVGQVATVYRAETIETGKAVAVKIFHEVGRNDRKRIELLRRPIARGAGRLDLPSVFVTAYECALTDDGRLFLVTELVDGPSVADLLRQGPLTPLRALGLAMRIGEALEVVLNPGFLDLRVAPQDIAVVKDEDRVKLRRSDVPILRRLGLADQLAAAEAPGRDPRYAPPEELPGLPPTEAGVVYQFGLVLYELLCGSTPFDGATPAQVHERKLRPLPIQLRTRHRALPASVERLVSRMLHPDPRTRPGDLTLVLNELWDVLCHIRTKMPATSISRVTARELAHRAADGPARAGADSCPFRHLCFFFVSKVTSASLVRKQHGNVIIGEASAFKLSNNSCGMLFCVNET